MSGTGGVLQIKPLPIRSMLLAPLASIPVVTVGGLGTSEAGVVSDLGVGLLFSVLVLPASYGAMLVLGLPLFVLLRKSAWLLPVACVLGALVPYAMFQDTTQPMALTAAAAGLAVAITAYLLRPR